jgi:aminoglycoside 2'-N-acetyltransferase I
VDPSGIEIQIVETYSAEDRLSLSGGDNDPNQTASYNLHWRPKTLHVLVIQDKITVSHVGLLHHTVTVNNQLVPVAGIGGVLTHPDFRGKGFSQMALKKALDHIQTHMNANFAILFCRDSLRPWYEKQGWSPIPHPVWIDQPQGSIQSPLAVMVKILGRERWPPGTVQLGCLPW